MFDRYTDVSERLDRDSLDGPDPPSHQLARDQLSRAGIRVKRIIRALPEAILFVNDSGAVITAWSQVRDEVGIKVAFFCESGMPALAPAERERTV